MPGAWRGGPGGGRRGRGRGGGGGEVEPGCGRGDRRFPPPSAPHLAGPSLARGPVPRGAQASPAGPPRRSRRRAARPPPAGSGPSRRRLPLHGRRSRRLHCGKLTSLAAAAAPPAPALAAMGAVTDGETSLPPSFLPPSPRPDPCPARSARLGSPQRRARLASRPPRRCPPPARRTAPAALRGSAPRAPASGLAPRPPPSPTPASHPADGPPSRPRPRSPAPGPFMLGHARALGAPRPQASLPGPRVPQPRAPARGPV